MLAGYVTYEELKIITGYTDSFLNKLILNGLNVHEADADYKRMDSKIKQTLFSLTEVEEWLKVHIF